MTTLNYPIPSSDVCTEDVFIFPLSFAQQRLWFLDQLDPGKASYNIPIAVRLNGRLNVAALEMTLREIVNRHEALRTTFGVVDGQPMQIISPVVTMSLPLEDLSDLDEHEREAEARRRARQEAVAPFNLSTGPLMRTKLLRLGAEEHVVLFTMHHIISDAWSLGVFVKEVEALYSAFVQGQPSPLPELTIQYPDFAEWQREWLSGDELEQQLSYWREQLSGASWVLQLPTTHSRPAVKSYQGKTRLFVLPEELSDELQRLSKKEGVSLFMILLAAFNLLLYRYTQQRDLLVGSPIAGRNRSETENLIGFFINTLVLRTRVDGNESFTQLLQQVREMCLGAYAHQDLPFEKLVEELEPERSMSHTPLFQVMFAMQNAPVGSPELPELRLSVMDVGVEVEKFDLSLGMEETERGLAGALGYNTDLYDAATIERLVNHFLYLLESIVTSPSKPVAELPLLPTHERQQLLTEWNQTSAPAPDSCLHELFEAQVERTPDAVAVVFEGQQLSYGELNQRANQLAHYLRRLGVGPEVLVGVYLERSVEMIVALLGILKAGGAFVPLDPTYPQERIAFMLADAGMAVLLTQANLRKKFGESAVRVVCLEEEWPLIRKGSIENLAGGSLPGELAYVIYTSGSTGLPKGVAIEHESLSNYLCWVNESLFAGRMYNLPVVTSLSFDACLKQIFAPLVRGDQVWMLSNDTVSDPSALLAALNTRSNVALNCVPSLWAALLNSVPKSEIANRIKSLRCLLVGGESLSPELLERTFVELPQLEVWNLYGPTESTANAVFSRITPGKEPLIGRPIANTEVYVLDSNLQPVPIGVVGELYLGGTGLARGYLGQPELTAERFVPHPFSGQPGKRLYRTGDLARFREDGQLDYQGRIDQQVKVRGYRIELGEIEAVLVRHPDVSECAVVARNDETGNKRLLAYVVPLDGGDTTLPTSELRHHLQQQLPEYMIPSTFIQLPALPLNSSGKVDRNALPVPDSARSLEQDCVAPRNLIEEMLVGLWREVLGVEQIGVHDDFFALGGHSLLATQLMSRVRDAFSVEVALRQLFASPTVAGLAQQVEAALRAGTGLEAPAIVPVSRDTNVPLSFAQQRLWFIDRLEPDNPIYNIPVAISLTGRLNVEALRETFDEVIRRHESLRTTFAVVGDQPRQIIHSTQSLNVSVLDLSHLSEEEREAETGRLMAEEARRPFDLSAGPLLRLTLLKQEELRHVLLLTLHHIVFDGWSLGVLVQEVAALYTAFHSGQPAQLSDLTIQYADFAHWQRTWLQGEVLEQQMAYWREQLTGAPPVLELPADHPRPAVQTFPGAHHGFSLSPELSEQLRQLSRREGVTLFMTLLAAFKLLLNRYTQQSDILVGSPIAGRNRGETEKLIGFFVNTLVLRTRVKGDESFIQLLQQVREVCLGAYAHQDVPFEKLVEALEPERSLSHTPLFQVMFALQNAAMGELELPELQFGMLKTNSATAKFDLFLSMHDSGEQVDGSMEYNSDLFEAATIARMEGHFRALLEAVVAQSHERVAELPLLSASEVEQLEQWNETTVAYDRACLHELFEEQVKQTPEQIAVIGGERSWSYRELNERANQIAGQLGLKSEERVGICVDRSLDMTAAVLGVLKAGGAYVPLDPSYPRERIALMVRDSGARVVLTQSWLKEQLPDAVERVVCLDEQWEAVAPEQYEPRVVSPDNLAYVIYTSGSTGTPKGVAMSHGAIANLIRWQIAESRLGEGAKTAQFSSFSFDVSCQEMFSTWASGGTLVLINEEDRRDTNQLLRILSETGVERLFLPPVALQQLAEASVDRPLPNSLKHVIAAGEQLHTDTLVGLFERLENCVLHNQYGPTETHVVTQFSMPLATGEWQQSPPIGIPIANTQVHLLDEQLQRVPIGVPGQLYLGGVGVARGYLGRPELTAERFIPDPWSTRPGARLYRTGDLARYLADGNIEFLGRADNQVKVRGFRIEPGEIESVLRLHPAVQDAVVIVRGQENKRLIAYVIAEHDSNLSATELIRFSGEMLPAYMIPSAFVFLEALPLTPSGKVDRNALPEPERKHSELESAYVAARNIDEELLAGIWSHVLGVERVGVYDNFFALGGHSLLATQVISRIRDTFQIELPLRRLFEQPTIAGLAASLRMDQQTSLAPPLQVVERSEIRYLSFAQQRMWFINQLEPDSPLYNISLGVRLNGQLQIDALRRTFDEVVRRHESLRTHFAVVDGEPLQVIEPVEPVSLPVIDLSNRAESERESEAQRLAAEESQSSFDLSTGPVWRARLLRLSEREHVLLVTLHHIVADGWSLGLLVQEVAALYTAFHSGQPAQLSDLTIQYADFAHWQRTWLQGEVLEQQMSYWREQLTGAPPVLELPTDHPRPAVQTFPGADHSFSLSPELSEQLRQLSRREGVTLFMTLLAAFKTLLYRYTQQTDILVGSPIAGRNRSETEQLIGFFVNTLVLRTRVESDESFSQLLQQVREVCLGAYAHQDVPFEKLVEELEPERSLSHTPLFQVMFMLQNAPIEKLELPELQLSMLTDSEVLAKFDLSLAMQEVDGVIGGTLVYNSDLFEPATINRMSEHLQSLLAAVVLDSQQPLSQLRLLSEVERRQLLVEWNETTAVYPTERSLHELFEAQVDRSSDAVALVFEQKEVSYGELNRRANQLAHYLRGLGVGPEVMVGVLMERSVEMVVSLLGILKAGGTYVPLDPSYPRERLSFMLEDAGARVLLTQRSLIGNLPVHEARLVVIEEDSQQIAQQSSENPAGFFSVEQLAYVIYTSGSTGQPKGVAIEHRSVVAFINWATATFPPPAFAGVLASTSICFDLSIFELFAPLSCGGAVILSENVLHLPTLPAATRVTLMNTVPSAMTELVRLQAVPASAQVINLAGETLAKQLVQDIYEQTTAQVWNLYAPSETTTYSTGMPVGREEEEAPTIGRPLSNEQIYILDQEMEPVPVGVAGEIYIGGVGLSRGYLNRANMTAEKFVPDPFSLAAGARLYRTGDIGRYLPNGEIQFEGRRDDQVKLRGFRIELGEIESRLRDHEAIRAAAVLVREDLRGEKQLVAYFVIAEDATEALTIDRLRSHLKERLPDYMIPTVFVQLEEMPLTSHGKLNRRALPAPERKTVGVDRTYIAPRDTMELNLTQIWEELLATRPIGMSDNFFELGGHSMLAARLMARIERLSGIKAPLNLIFQEPTIERLSLALRRMPGAVPVSTSLVEIQSGTSPAPFFCIHPSGGQVLSYVPLSRYLGMDQTFYGLQARGLDRTQEPATSIEEMATHYIEVVRGVQPEGPYVLGGWSMGGVVAYEMGRQLHAQGHEVSLLALLDAHLPASGKQLEEMDDLRLLETFALDMGISPEQLEISPEELLQVGPEERLDYILHRAQQCLLLPPGIELSEIRHLFNIFKINIRAMQEYVPQPSPVPLTLFTTSAQFSNTVWSALSPIQIHPVSGNHFTMMQEPHVEILARKLKVCLDTCNHACASA